MIVPYDSDARAETLRQLQSLVDALSNENHVLATDLDAVARRHAAAADESEALLRVCVAHERLADAGSEADVVAAIDEIVSAMIGCEEFALYERTRSGALHVLHRGPLLAVEPDTIPGVREEILGAFRAPSVPVLRDFIAADAPAGVSAIVPLTHGREAVAVLVLGRSLAHKPGRVEADDALLHLLGRFAGRCLRVARLLEVARA